MKTTYLRCDTAEVGTSVLLVGDPARVDSISEFFEEVYVDKQNREFRVCTGLYRGKKVTAASSGIGGASAAIAVCEFSALGVKRIARVGTVMGVKCPLGTVAVPSAAARFDEVSTKFLPIEFPALASPDLHKLVIKKLEDRGLPHMTGVVASFSDFYGEMAPGALGPRSWGSGRPLPEHVRLARDFGVLGYDMETALVYAAAPRQRLDAVSVCLVTVHADDPAKFLNADVRADVQRRMIQAVLDAVIEHGGDGDDHE